MHGRLLHVGGAHQFVQYGQTGEFINSISRQILNERLMIAAEKYPNVSFAFEQRCVGIDLPTNQMRLVRQSKVPEERVETVVKPDVIIGADGAYSAVRDAMTKNYGYVRRARGSSSHIRLLICFGSLFSFP